MKMKKRKFNENRSEWNNIRVNENWLERKKGTDLISSYQFRWLEHTKTENIQQSNGPKWMIWTSVQMWNRLKISVDLVICELCELAK